MTIFVDYGDIIITTIYGVTGITDIAAHTGDRVIIITTITKPATIIGLLLSVKTNYNNVFIKMGKEQAQRHNYGVIQGIVREFLPLLIGQRLKFILPVETRQE